MTNRQFVQYSLAYRIGLAICTPILFIFLTFVMLLIALAAPWVIIFCPQLLNVAPDELDEE